jgi:hypothetical protein
MFSPRAILSLSTVPQRDFHIPWLFSISPGTQHMHVFSQLFILLCSWLKVVNIWIKFFDVSPMSLLRWWTLSRPFKLYVCWLIGSSRYLYLSISYVDEYHTVKLLRLPKMSAYFRKHRDSIPCRARLGMVSGGWYLKRRWVIFIFFILAHILSSARLVYYPFTCGLVPVLSASHLSIVHLSSSNLLAHYVTSDDYQTRLEPSRSSPWCYLIWKFMTFCLTTSMN